jgi:hypothetical protein
MIKCPQTGEFAMAIPTASDYGPEPTVRRASCHVMGPRSGSPGHLFFTHGATPQAHRTKSGVVVEGNIDAPVHGATHTKPMLHQATAEKKLDGKGLNISMLKGLNLWLTCTLTSGKYMRSHRQLLFLSSIIVALIAIVIQYASETEVPGSSIRLIRPGWAQHRDEGWQYQRDNRV